MYTDFHEKCRLFLSKFNKNSNILDKFVFPLTSTWKRYLWVIFSDVLKEHEFSSKSSHITSSWWLYPFHHLESFFQYASASISCANLDFPVPVLPKIHIINGSSQVLFSFPKSSWYFSTTLMSWKEVISYVSTICATDATDLIFSLYV
jgi:hypothetical protein